MDIEARMDRLAQLLEERLDIRGRGFKVKLRRAGRLLPRHLRAKGQMLIEAEARAGHPRLLRQMDEAALDLAAHEIETYLLSIDPWSRRRAIALDFGAGLGFKLLAVVMFCLAVLLWRGYL